MREIWNYSTLIISLSITWFPMKMGYYRIHAGKFFRLAASIVVVVSAWTKFTSDFDALVLTWLSTFPATTFPTGVTMAAGKRARGQAEALWTAGAISCCPIAGGGLLKSAGTIPRRIPGAGGATKPGLIQLFQPGPSFQPKKIAFILTLRIHIQKV